jgi:hypothetical protein
MSLVEWLGIGATGAVAALDGDHLVIELGLGFASLFAGETDDHHGTIQADSDGVFNFPSLNFKDFTSSCLFGELATGPILAGGGGGNVLAPSCDNTTFGG